jgi:serine/threonine protein kinase
LTEVRAAFPQLEILELIGQGGMGAVFKARQLKLNRFVALKILPEAMGRDPAFAERFIREGQMLARLHHPNIVTVHDFGQAGGFFYLLMEYVEGVNLRQAMQAGRFTPEQALAIVPMICDALQYAHDEGVLHRDIKPENILLDTKGKVRLVDFGIAKLAAAPENVLDSESAGAPPDTALTDAGSALGTPNYMAPEQRISPSTVDQRADIYSLGVVFYEMLTGERPTGRFAPPSHKTPMDSRVDDVVMRALEKQRDKRFGSAGEVRTRVEAITATGTAAGKPSHRIPPAGESHPLSLSANVKKVLLASLILLFVLMLTQIIPAIGGTLRSLSWMFRSGRTQAIIISAGVFGIAWLAVGAWRRWNWLLEPRQIVALPSNTADSPLAFPFDPAHDRWFPAAWIGVMLCLILEVVLMLFHQVMMVAQAVASDAGPLALYSLFFALLPILLVIFSVRRELRRSNLMLRAPVPAWFPRLALLWVALALVLFLPWPDGDVPTASFSQGGFVVVIPLAILTLNRVWRAIALASMAQIVVMCVLNVVNVIIASARGQLPFQWSQKIGGIDAMTLLIIVQLLSLVGFAAGLAALLLPGVRAAFGLAPRGSQSRNAAEVETSVETAIDARPTTSRAEGA